MKWINRILAILFILLSLICLTFALGPRPTFKAVDSVPLEGIYPLDEVEQVVVQKEAKLPHIRPDNEARIIWADSVRKTPYAIVYLHGFSASQGEGHPLHQNIASQFGCNLYLSRLHAHGLKGKESFNDYTPAKLVESAKEAIRIGRSIGDRVILMSTSTGSTLSIYLAGKDESIAGLIMLSPNIALSSSAANLLTGPWGMQIIHQLVGPYRKLDRGPKYKQYWTHYYKSDAIVALQNLIDQTMRPEVFRQLDMPIFVSYYYKNEKEKDRVISIDAIRSFLEEVETPEAQITEVPLPDAGMHVLGSSHVNAPWESVQQALIPFMKVHFYPTPITPSKPDLPVEVEQ